MIDNRILAGAERQAHLEAAKAAFFLSGGRVDDSSPPFECKPLPFRKHPEPSAHFSRRLKQSPECSRQEEAKKRAELVAVMAESMTCRQVADELGIAENTVRDIGRREGFKFVQAARGKPPAPRTKGERMAERIIALRDIGLTRHQASKHLQISHQTLSRIVEEHEIDYPKAKSRK